MNRYLFPAVHISVVGFCGLVIMNLPKRRIVLISVVMVSCLAYGHMLEKSVNLL